MDNDAIIPSVNYFNQLVNYIVIYNILVAQLGGF